MKICLCQCASHPGDLARNLAEHLRWAQEARKLGAELLVFPELSLTGYHPSRACSLALHPEDPQLQPLQEASREYSMTIAVGLPTPAKSRPNISLVFFQPDQPVWTYGKSGLHPDEKSYFQAAPPGSSLGMGNHTLGIAICCEVSLPEHTRRVFDEGASLYLASAAKTSQGVSDSIARLQRLALSHCVPVLLVNSVGPCEGFQAGGQSSVWNRQGTLVEQLDGIHEGLLCYDTVANMASGSRRTADCAADTGVR